MQECVGGAAGQRLGNYHLSQLLGNGGFAEVYLGEHIYLKTLAAIKVLEMELANDALDSFLNEARTIARLEHPNIVRVLDFGMEDQTPFLVMSYAPSGTLRQLYPRGTILPSTSIVAYVKQIAAALQYAHDKKLIHRDVKPENMLLGANNEVLLSDFGLAIIAKSASSIHLQDRAGTIAYMAPEQLEGKPCAASDQYALGVVVYEWLTGSVPFNGFDLQIALQHVQLDPPALREKVPSISPAVERVVMKALAKDPAQRFPRVQDFAKAFEQACSEEPSVFSIPTFSYPLPEGVPADEVQDTPAPPHPFTPKPLDIPKPDVPHTPSPLSTLILPPGPLNTPKPPVLGHNGEPGQQMGIESPVPLDLAPTATESAVGTAEFMQSVPSPINSLLTRPFPLSTQSLRESAALHRANAIHRVPTVPDKSQNRFKQPVTRRKVLAGLAGLAALGVAGGGISWLAFLQKPERLSSGQTIKNTLPSAQGSHTANTPIPTNQLVVPAHQDTPTPATTSAPVPTTPTLTPTSVSQPRPTPVPKLTIQIVNPPTEVINNSQVIVNVTGSEAGVTTILHANYGVPPYTYDSGMQVTDGQGNASLVWQVQVGKLKKDHTTATVTVSGVDQGGQQAQSESIPVNILPNNQSK